MSRNRTSEPILQMPAFHWSEGRTCQIGDSSHQNTPERNSPFAIDLYLKKCQKVHVLSKTCNFSLVSLVGLLLDYEYALLRLVRRARRERNSREKIWPREILEERSVLLAPRILRGHFFLAGFSVSLDGLSERGSTRSLGFCFRDSKNERPNLYSLRA